MIYSDDAQSLIEAISKGAVSESLVLPVGGDQRYVDFNLRDRIERYNDKLTDVELMESTYELFLRLLRRKSFQRSKENLSPALSQNTSINLFFTIRP